MAVFTLSQRSVESILEQLDDVYRRIEDCDDIDTLRDHARALLQAARLCELLAGEYEEVADRAEDMCPECGTAFCASCGECPECGDCCVFADPDDGDDFPLYLEYDEEG